MLGIRTRGRRMVGADEATELWRPPTFSPYCFFPTKERFEASKRRKMRNVELEEEGDNFWVVLKW